MTALYLVQCWHDCDAYIAERDLNEAADFLRTVEDIQDGQFHRPTRVICIDVAAGYATDVSADFARALNHRRMAGDFLSSHALEFIDLHIAGAQAA